MVVDTISFSGDEAAEVVKIADVANEAGVSVATVSRALNFHPTVNEGMAARVREAAERLGYRPNGVARSLRRKSSDVLALIISDVSNPFFTSITRGVEDVAQRNGFSVILCNSDEDPGKEADYLRIVEQEQVAGVLLSPHALTTDVSHLQAAGIALVVIDRPLRVEIDSVMVHSTEGARVATEHLIDEGWRTPACITGPQDAETAQQRLHGYQEAITAAGFEERVEHAPFRQQGGALATAALLDSPNPPDSLFVGNAQMALGVLGELRRRKLVVGRDIGVVTFDDAPWAPFINPPMTVVAQPAYDVGAQAAELLMDRIRTGETAERRHIFLSATLIIRESSRRLSE